MAIFRLRIQALGRANGRKAVNAAAYRAGERIRDERTGRLYNHAMRTDVLYAEIVLPQGLQGQEVAWARDRAALWNAAERAERRRDARVAREYEIGLPAELTHEQRLNLTLAFAREIAERYQVVVDTTMHAPRAGSDQRNYHAHLLTTTRRATVEGLGRKSNAELNETDRLRHGLLRSGDEFKFLRERWGALANAALRLAGLEARVDHRSLEAQGIDREPALRLPRGAYREELQGHRSEIAERMRERYRERVAARAARAAERVNGRSNEFNATVRDAPGIAAREARGIDGRRGPSLEDVRREAREAWLQFRSQAGDAALRADRGAARDTGLPDQGPAKDGPLGPARELDSAL